MFLHGSKRYLASITAHGIVISLLLLSGCGYIFHPPKMLGPPPIEVPVSNPAQIGPVEPEFLWQQIVDTIDDYFRIANEQRVRRDANGWLEGRLKTYPEVGATLFEPWRRDSTAGFERLQSTFQAIRRTAIVRVLAGAEGYLVEVQVIKEQEDVDQSQFATTGSAAMTHDGTIVRTDSVVRGLPITLGWFEAGRDSDLERRLIERIVGRVSNVESPSHKRLY